ncbi:Transcriptional repressor CTCFL [Folsomia candida]|uniref:Transcriptional repressor CTCFL n=1 Tax=Folsomia candida TaxID=158441 RepID=A0A226DDU8_FOLCA|nr:Transcriptional repressor CTCFL [Folsomia candida]
MSHSGFPELMAHLECPVCLDTFSGRVLQCKNGHNICAEHAPKLRKKCPVCRTSYGRYSCRNLLAENLAALQTKNWIDQENPRVQDRRRFWDAHPAMDRNVTNNDDESSRVGDSSSNDESSSGDESSESDESFAASFRCTLCPIEFKTLAKLRRHIVTHTKEKPFKCSTCAFSFSEKYNLQAHERVHLAKSDRPLVQCTLCLQTFLNNSTLRQHIRNKHENSRPSYDCPLLQETKQCLSFEISYSGKLLYQQGSNLPLWKM